MASSALKARGISSPSIPLRLQSLHLSSQFAPSFQTIRIAAVALPVLGTTFSNVGSWISSIWDTVLKAVPKKKQSYARKRTRQLANKGLKDIPNVVPCSSCGRPKRPHMLCRNCMALIKEMWMGTYKKYEPTSIWMKNQASRDKKEKTRREQGKIDAPDDQPKA